MSGRLWFHAVGGVDVILTVCVGDGEIFQAQFWFWFWFCCLCLCNMVISIYYNNACKR